MTNVEKLRIILASPQLYIQKFMRVVDKTGNIVPFKLNPEQKYLLDNMDKYNIVCKSRQLGITTLSCAKSIYLAITKPYTNCLLMSYSIDSATQIFDKLKELYYNLPECIRIPLIANNKKELAFTNHSKIDVMTCGNKDVGRGSTYQYVHLSEVAFMKDTINKQLLAIEQTLTPNAQIILESTANGMNYFYELWNKAEHKESMYKPFFFSWIDDKIMFKQEYKQFVNRYKQLHKKLPKENELDDDEKLLFKKGATIEQLVWRRMKISNSSVEQFRQEFPSTAEEAFITTGTGVFDANKVMERLQYIDSEKVIVSRPNDLPILFYPYFGRQLTVWDAPEIDAKYYVGVDTGEGDNQDYSAIEVLNEQGEQVAEFKDNKVKPYVFSQLVNDIGYYYNKALLIVEKASAGHIVVDKLKNDFIYTNMYKYVEYDARGKKRKKVGWLTTNKSKPLMISAFTESFETGQMLVRSKDLLKEMKVYQFEDSGSMNAQRGFHDDLVMSMAMALQGLTSGKYYR